MRPRSASLSAFRCVPRFPRLAPLVRLATVLLALLLTAGCARLAEEASFLNDQVGKPAERLYEAWGPPLIAERAADGQPLTARYDARIIRDALPEPASSAGAVSVRGPAGSPSVVVQDAPLLPLREGEDRYWLPLTCPVLIAIDVDGTVTGWRYVDPACPTETD